VKYYLNSIPPKTPLVTHPKIEKNGKSFHLKPTTTMNHHIGDSEGPSHRYIYIYIYIYIYMLTRHQDVRAFDADRVIFYSVFYLKIY
jgi:hypothetical protein